MIQISSRQIVERASHSKVINKEKEIYQYGMEIIISSIIDFLLLLTIGVMFDCTLQAILYYFTFAYIRKYSGGLHMETYTSCIAVHNLIFLGLVITKDINYVNVYVYTILILCIIIFYNLAPVKNKNKPLLDYEVDKYKKKACIIYVSYLIMAGVMQGRIGSTILFVLLVVNLLMIVCIQNNE